MSSIDKRVVQMIFDNDKFEDGIRATMESLKNLDNNLQLKNGAQAFNDINAGAEKVDLSPIRKAIELVEDKFMSFGVLGTVALVKLGDKVTEVFGNAIKTITTMGRKRALNIQQAEFQFRALGLDVEATMGAANRSVTDTAFGLDEAALAAANFAATGIKDAGQLENILLGVAGVAAMGGREFSEVANVFGKVAGQGRLMGDDLNRMASYGINAAATMAEQMGITEADFRDLVSKGEISFEHFANSMTAKFGASAKEANKLYTGALANMKAALGRIGAEFWSPILFSARDLFNALTPFINQVKHILTPAIVAVAQVIDFFVQAAITGIKSATAALEPLAERFKIITMYLKNEIPRDATTIWLREFVNGLVHLRNAVDKTFDIVKNAFNAVFPQIKEDLNWDDVLENIGHGFERFALSIMPTNEQLLTFQDVVTKTFEVIKIFIDHIKAFAIPIFEALKAILEYLWPIFLKIGEVVGKLLKTAFDLLVESIKFLADRFDAISAAVKAFFDDLDNTYGITEKLKDGFENARTAIIEFLDGILGGIPLIQSFGDSTEFAQAAMDASAAAATWMKDKIDKLRVILGPAAQSVKEFFENFKNIDWIGAWETFSSTVVTVLDVIKSKFEYLKIGLAPIGDFFKTLFGEIGEYFKNFTGGDLLAIGTGAGLAAFTYQIIGFITKIKDFISGGSDVVKGFKELLNGISDALTEFIDTVGGSVKAESLKTMAIAVAILVGSVLALSLIDVDQAMFGLTAVGGLLALLGVVLSSMSKLEATPVKSVSMIVIAQAITVLSLGVLLLSIALKHLSTADPASLAVATVALGFSIAIMSAALKFLSISTTTMRPASLMISAKAMIAVAAAMVLVGLALKVMASINPEQIGQSLIMFAISMLAMTGLLSNIQGKAIAGAAAIMAIGISMFAIALALNILASVNPERIGQALLMFAIAMLALTGVLDLISGRSLTGAAAIIAIALAVNLLAVAVLAFGLIPLPILITGLLGITVALMGLALVVAAMSMATAGAGVMLAIGAAMVLLAVSVGILAVSLLAFAATIQAFGSMDQKVITDGLGFLALAFLALFVAMLPMAIISPLLLILGIGFIALGAGIAILSTALVTLLAGIPGIVLLLALAPLLAVLSILAIPLTLLGIAFVALGAGLILVAAAALIFGAALGIIAVSLPLAVVALQMFAHRSEEMATHSDAIIQFSAALLLFGGAATFAGIGTALLGIGMLALSIGLLAMGLAMMVASSQLLPFSAAMDALIPQASGIAALGLAMAAAGILFAIGSLGFILMGVALMALGLGFTMLEGVGDGAIALLLQLAEASETFAWNAPGLMAGAAGLLAFGIAAIAVGLASVLLSQGVSSLADSVNTLSGGSDAIVDALSDLVSGLESLAPSIGVVTEVIDPLTSFAAALAELWPNAYNSAQTLTALAPAIDNVGASAGGFNTGSIDGISNSLDGLAGSANDEPITDVDAALKNLNGTSVPGLDDTTASMNDLTNAANPAPIDGVANSVDGLNTSLDPTMLQNYGIDLSNIENVDPSGMTAMGDSTENVANVDPANMSQFSDILGGMGSLDPSALDIMGDSITDIGETDPEGVADIGESLKEIEGIDPTPVKEINTALQEMQTIDATPIDTMSTALLSLSDTIGTFDAPAEVFDALGLSLTDLRAHAIILSDASPSLDSMSVSVTSLTATLTTLDDTGSSAILTITSSMASMSTSVKSSLISTDVQFQALAITINQSMLDSIKALLEFQNGLLIMVNAAGNSTVRVAYAVSGMQAAVSSSLNNLASEARRAGNNFVQGFIDAIQLRMRNAYDKAYELGVKAVEGLNKGAGNASPSIKGYKAGINLIQGSINGMEYLRASLVARSTDIGSSAANGLSLGLQHINALSAGATLDMQSSIGFSIDDQLGAIRLASLLESFSASQIDYTDEIKQMSNKLDGVLRTNEILLGINKSLSEMEINMDGETVAAVVTPHVNRNIRVDQQRRER